MGGWYWIGLAVGLGAALGVLCAGALASSGLGTLVAVVIAAGGFFAVHDDGNVAAFRWEDVAGPLGLRVDCEGQGTR